MTCRGCGPGPDPEQDREHNDWCPDNPRRTHRGKDDAVALRVENERLRAALEAVMGACDAECAACGAYYVAKRALADIARGDYSDPLCMKTPEQRAREALAPRKDKQ